MSTIVDPNVTVISHTNDGNPTVYMDFGDGTKNIIGYEDPDKSYKRGDQYQYYDPTTATNYHGQYLIPASAYDYSQDVIKNKAKQDWLYILYGEPSGEDAVDNTLRRYFETLKKRL